MTDDVVRTEMHRRSAVAILAAVILLTIQPLWAQNLITQDDWEGFVIRSPEGRFDRCVLYNRTVPALNASPYGMLGISHDANNNVGLMVFYQPRSLTRAAQAVVQLRVDNRLPISLAGEIVSDFHVVIPGPLDGPTLTALRNAREIEVTTETKSARFALAGVAAVLERLRTCVDANAQGNTSR
jgi:hypothetical protein